MLTLDQQKTIGRLAGSGSYAPGVNPETGKPFGWNAGMLQLFAYVELLIDIASAKRRMREEFTTEWEVSWFPPGRSDQKRTYVTEGKALDRYAVANELGHAPILASREVVTKVSDWVIVKTATEVAS